ncbi:protein FAM50A-like [Hypanus sabinus]|uniref:protein FAM50A-like n=1 Tax=Hypanus sabinus TaxID=79690 RepID=UPI0028C49676|nr:protein FAM50A-like [Hypanus sabinus]
MAQYKGAASEAGRAMQLMKKREKQREQLQQLKQKIAEENLVKSNIDKKFSTHYDAVEAELKSSTVGKDVMLRFERVLIGLHSECCEQFRAPYHGVCWYWSESREHQVDDRKMEGHLEEKGWVDFRAG